MMGEEAILSILNFDYTTNSTTNSIIKTTMFVENSEKVSKSPLAGLFLLSSFSLLHLILLFTVFEKLLSNFSNISNSLMFSPYVNFEDFEIIPPKYIRKNRF